jgi:ATP-dependent Clp protease ATP-binding subunit ClpA
VRKGIHLVISPAAKRFLVNEGHDEKFGARPLRRTIQEMLEHTIADGILSGEYEQGTVLTVGVKKSEIVVTVAHEN